jgi:hypothetical protein
MEGTQMNDFYYPWGMPPLAEVQVDTGPMPPPHLDVWMQHATSLELRYHPGLKEVHAAAVAFNEYLEARHDQGQDK